MSLRDHSPLRLPRPAASQRRQRSAGFALVAAIFLLTVLAALGAFIVSISTNQQMSSAMDVEGERAYQAARSGIEWGVYQVQATPAYNFSYGTPPVAVGSANPNSRVCPASPTSFAFPATAPTLSAFTVTVQCTAYPDTTYHGPTVYQLIATACNQPAAGACPNASPGQGYIERQVQVSF